MKRIIATTLLLFTGIISKAQNTTAGTDFWVGYGHHQFMEQSSNYQQMVLYIGTGVQSATVTVTIHNSGPSPAYQWKRVYNIPPNTIISTGTATPAYSLPAITGTPGSDSWTMPKSGSYDCRLWTIAPPTSTGGGGLFNKKAIHIQSDMPVVAYSHIYGSASSGATLLYPSNSWGYNYQAVNSDQSYSSNCYSWMYIIANEDSTTFMLTPTVPTRAMDKTNLQPGIAKLITLNKGQIYSILGANTGADVNGNGGTASTGYQLTGTKVKVIPNANNQVKQVAVYCGSSRTANPQPCGSGGGDNDMQQLMPVEDWGTEYLTAPTSGSSKADTFAINTYKIAVFNPATVVKRNGVVLTGLIDNSYYKFSSNTADYISADQPIFVAQFMTGGPCGAGTLGDPEMFYLTPLDKGVKKTAIYRNTVENIDLNYLTLIVPDNGLSSLKVDSSSVFDHVYPHSNMAGYKVVVKRWSPSAQAQTVIECDSAFTGITYGLGSVESYGYNIGFKTSHYITRTIYHFTGIGSWSDSSAWLNGKVAPLVINAGEEVIIEPSNGTLNYTGNIIVKPGGKLEVVKGKKLNVTGEIIVQD